MLTPLLKHLMDMGRMAFPAFLQRLLYISLQGHYDTIFNCSVLSGALPDSWKVARMAPIFKEGSLMNNPVIGLYQYCKSFNVFSGNWCIINHTAILVKTN